KVISSSRGDLDLVFRTMLETATRICDASFGTMLLFEGEVFRRVALYGAPQRYLKFAEKNPLLPRSKHPSLDRVAKNKRLRHIKDMAVAEPHSPIVRFGGARTLLNVPMIKDGTLVGIIGIYRREVRLFTDNQIELLS